MVGGTLSSPNISLTSDAQPPIPQSDLLSYLAFGQIVVIAAAARRFGSHQRRERTTSSAQARRWRAGSWPVWRSVSSPTRSLAQAARSLGADVFTITPADVQTDVGNFLRATQFEFGKYIKSHTFVEVQSPLDPKR